MSVLAGSLAGQIVLSFSDQKDPNGTDFGAESFIVRRLRFFQQVQGNGSLHCRCAGVPRSKGY